MSVQGKGVATLLRVVGITHCIALVSGLTLKPFEESMNATHLQPRQWNLLGDVGRSVTCKTARVFNLGLPRTGTESFCEYGESLGYGANHQKYSQQIKPAALHECVEDPSRCLHLFGPEDPHKPDMFCDHPVPGIGCQLASAYPTAGFVLMTRSFELYYPSARFWMCRWGAPMVCPGEAETNTSFSLTSHIDLYGRAYNEFCHKASRNETLEALCGDDYGLSEEHVWNEMGLATLVKNMQYEHDSKIKSCIPSDRLLVLDLEEEEKAEQIGSFLNCSGKLPEYPHLHWTGVNQKGTLGDGK